MDSVLKSASKKQNQCVDKYINAHQKFILTRCIERGDGEGVAGGCYHIAGPIQYSVIEAAIKQCGIALN